MESKLYKLNAEDLKKIGVGALVAVSGALLTYLTEAITQIDWGEMTPVIMALWSVLANVARKALTNNVGQFGRADK